jgi:hypothetical protein
MPGDAAQSHQMLSDLRPVVPNVDFTMVRWAQTRDVVDHVRSTLCQRHDVVHLHIGRALCVKEWDVLTAGSESSAPLIALERAAYLAARRGPLPRLRTTVEARKGASAGCSDTRCTEATARRLRSAGRGSD